MSLRNLWFILIPVLWTGYFRLEGFDFSAGGAAFTAFPQWYATLFSGFYLALLLILVALICTPLVLLYQGWTYRVFRARIDGSDPRPKGPNPPGTPAPPELQAVSPTLRPDAA